jgi:hypothetical protein
MLLSWDVSVFPDDNYYWYQYENGSIIYINGSSPWPNFLCNQTFDANPDIAGVGVSPQEPGL